METKSFWHTSAYQSEIRHEIISEEGIQNPILITSGYSSISLGTEKLVATGKIPQTLHEIMKVPYMSGDFNFPIKYGYSMVGQTPEKEWIHCLHPHQRESYIDRSSCYFFSNEIEPTIATQFSNLETVVNALWASKVKADDTVLICGTGSVGILLAQTIRKYIGAELFIQETNPAKREKLRDFGFDLCTSSREYSISFNVSAHEKGLQYCIDHAQREGKIIELSWYGDQPVSLQLGGNFHFKRLQIISSQVSEIPNYKKETDDFYSRKKMVEELLKTIDYKPFISAYILFEEMPLFFENSRKNKPNNDFITVVTY